MKKSRTDIEGVRLDIEQRGARIVYESLLEVCQDKGAPAQARAAAGVAVLRAGGLFDPKRRPDDLNASELSLEELNEILPRLQTIAEETEARIADRAKTIAAYPDDDDGADIFA